MRISAQHGQKRNHSGPAGAETVHRQAELRHQPVGERPRVHPGQPHRPTPAAHLHPGPGRHRRRAPTVAAAGCRRARCRPRRWPRSSPARSPAAARTARAPRSAPPAAPRTSGHTTGPPEENAYAVEPVGRGADHAVAAEAGQRPAVDVEGHLEHPLPRGLLHRRLVQGPVGSTSSPARVTRRRGSAAPRPRTSAAPRPDRVRQLLRLRLGQEAHVAEVDPDQGGPARASHLGRPQERAVPAEHQHRARRRRRPAPRAAPRGRR